MISSRSILGDIGNKNFHASNQNLAVESLKPIQQEKQESTENQEKQEEKMEVDSNEPKVEDHDYSKDSLHYLLKYQKTYRIKSDFFGFDFEFIKKRCFYIDSMISFHLQMELPTEVLFLSVSLFDSYLDARKSPNTDLFLLSASCLLLAEKIELRDYSFDALIKWTDKKYTKEDFIKMESKIVKKLNFHLTRPTAIDFLKRFCQLGYATHKEYTMAKYFMELSLHLTELIYYDPSSLAASSLFLSLWILRELNWKSIMRELGFDLSNLLSLKRVIQKLATLIIKTNKPTYPCKEASLKYNRESFYFVSSEPALTGKRMEQAALGMFDN